MSSTPTTTAERRRNVFLAARTIFTGQKAFIRDKNAVERLVSRHEWSFRKALLNLDKHSVIDITLSLLRKQVFESEVKAKLVFPELYHVSAVRGLQHDTSERNAARLEAKAQEVVSQNEDVLYEADDQEECLEDIPLAEEVRRPARDSSPTLFPVYLSYAVQHKLLNAVQRLLEECCYDFARTWVPSVIQEHGWDCAEAVEIGRWSEVLPPKFAYMNADATSLESRDDLLDALRAISPLRHAAVHRLPTYGKGLEEMLEKALHLVQVLHDDSRASKMEAILEDFRARRRDMETCKTNLENHLDQQLQDIEEQKAALDRKAQEAKESMVMQDIENTKSMSSLFERSVNSLIYDNGKAKPMLGKSHEPELGTLEDGMAPSSDLEAAKPGRHEAKPRVLGDDETTDGNPEHIYERFPEADSEPLMQDEEVGDDSRSMQPEAEPNPLKDPKDTDDDHEPTLHETELGDPDDYEDPYNGEDEEGESGAVGLDDDNCSDIENMQPEGLDNERAVLANHDDDGDDIESVRSAGDIAVTDGYELEEHGVMDVRHKGWYRERHGKKRINNERVFKD